MKTKIIFLVRHGEYENPNNVLPNRLKGFPLSIKGREQIGQIAELLKNQNIDVIYSSPILRTKQSARILQSIFHKPLVFSKSIIEASSPVQGMNKSIVKEIEKVGDTFKLPIHIQKGGETVEHVYIRMKRLIKKILLNDYYTQAVVVSHGDPMMVLALIESGNIIDSTHAIHSYISFLPYIPKGGMIQMVYKNSNLQFLKKVNY